MTPCRVTLSEDDFSALVRGEVVTTNTIDGKVEIILQDIGFDRMALAIRNAAGDSSLRPSPEND